MIPKLIHQTWKTANIPDKWRPLVLKVKELNPDWKYKLWTDSDNNEFVKNEFPEFYSIYSGLSRNIMKADVIRYLIMYRMGGVYLDIDYEVLRPFNFENYQVILPHIRDIQSGDPENQLGNSIFASIPGHPFWSDVINYLKINPPKIKSFMNIVAATGPALLTRIYQLHKYPDIYTPERIIYHPPAPSGKKDMEKIYQNGISLGIHHSWGSWKEKWTWAYQKYKFSRKM